MNLERIIAVRTAKTVYRDEDKCVKLFDSDYSKAEVLNEALNQARIEETDLAIPKILEVTKANGKWAIVSEYISGKTLDRLMEENPDKENEYLDIFIKAQIDVHARKSPLLNKLKDKMLRRLFKAGLEPAVLYDLHTRLESLPQDLKICHGDFNPSNIIIGEKGTPYILDWVDASQGTPAADAARTYLLFWLAGNITLADKYLDSYCRKSNVSKSEVQKWIPLAAASQLAEGKEEEREFLLYWINVVDYE